MKECWYVTGPRLYRVGIMRWVSLVEYLIYHRTRINFGPIESRLPNY